MYLFDTFIMNTPDACTPDTTSPTFAGIASLLAKANGSLLAAWLAATDSTPPIYYDVFIQKATATGLFNSANRVFSTNLLSILIFQDALGNLLQAGDTYFVGVRARDAVGNVDGNTVSISAVSSGVLSESLGTVAQVLQSALINSSGDLDVELDDSDELNGEAEDNEEIDGEVKEEC